MTRRKITRANVRGFSRHQPQTLWGGKRCGVRRDSGDFIESRLDGPEQSAGSIQEPSGCRILARFGPWGNAVLGLCVYPQFGMRSGYRDRFQRVRDTFRRILSLEPGPWTLGIERPFRLIFFKHLPLCCSSTDTAQHNG